MKCCFKVQLQCSTFRGLRSVYPFKLCPKLRYMQNNCSCTQFRTAVYVVQTRSSWKCTVSDGATAPIDSVCTPKISTDENAVFGWSCTYTYLFRPTVLCNVYITKFISNDLIMTINIALGMFITLYAMNVQYISWEYVLWCNYTKSRSCILIRIAFDFINQ